ncbi:hypothetical protein FXO38_20387 [Capsicum annuum]|nr:hypothetical protein FXO38_20387 [Capsicum annuum]
MEMSQVTRSATATGAGDRGEREGERVGRERERAVRAAPGTRGRVGSGRRRRLATGTGDRYCGSPDSFGDRQPKFWDLLKRACTKLMKILVAIQQRHPYSFGDKCVLPLVMEFCLSKILDPEPHLMSFEQFMIQCMVMVKTILEGKEYKTNLTGRVVDENRVTFEQMKQNISSTVAGLLTSLLPTNRVVLLCNVLIRRYFVLTASDMEEWYQNPETFYHEQDSVLWSEKQRPCAEALYIVLFENYSQLLGPVVVSILQEAMNGCPSAVNEITPALLLKDAAYGAAAYIYYELSNYLSFKDWFNGALSLELTNDHPNMRIIHRKVALILGQWVSEHKLFVKSGLGVFYEMFMQSSFFNQQFLYEKVVTRKMRGATQIRYEKVFSEKMHGATQISYEKPTEKKHDGSTFGNMVMARLVAYMGHSCPPTAEAL